MKAVIIHDVNRDVFTAFAKGIRGAVAEGVTEEDAVLKLKEALDVLLNYRAANQQPVYGGNFVTTEVTL